MSLYNFNSHNPDVANYYSFTSADESLLEHAPRDYRPLISSKMLYDDEIPDMPESDHWYLSFNGGSSSTIVFVRSFGDCIVSLVKGPFGPEAEIACDCGVMNDIYELDNIHDAFYLAEQRHMSPHVQR